jgi:septal ring factor EnvC (AmiA/AmiB activator)
MSRSDSIVRGVTKYGVCLLLLLAFSGQTVAQKQSEKLKAKEKALQRKIAGTKKLISSAQTNQRVTMAELAIINQQISYREELISTYNYQVRKLERDIEENKSVVESMEQDLVKLKAEYAEMLNFAYKHRNAYSNLMFIFAADNINQAYQRTKYMQQYAEYRQKQVDIIKQTKIVLSKKIDELEEIRRRKQGLASAKKTERSNYLSDKTQQQTALGKLQLEEKKLKAQLQDQERKRKQMSRQIKKAIEKEIAAAAKKTGTKFTLRPEVKIASKSFEKNKGKLTWPVAEGEVVSAFGKHLHPVIENVYIENNGVDIATRRGSTARAVFKGKVTSIFVIEGAGKVVMVGHGAYRTVYSNLKEVWVKKGDEVSASQDIGVLLPNDTGKISELHFEIWKITTDNMYKQNPAHWLSK